MTTLAEFEAMRAKLRARLRKASEDRLRKFADDPRALFDLETNRAVKAKTLRLDFAERQLDVVQNDRDADLVSLGMRFSYALALYDLDVLAKLSTPRRKSTNALKPYQRPRVTDADIRAAVRKYATRKEQAKHLGIHKDTLRNRLRAMKNRGR